MKSRRWRKSLVAQQQIYAPNCLAAIENLSKHAATFRQSNDSYLNGPVLRAAEEGIDIGRTWFELYENMHIRLMKLASDRRAQTEQGSPIFSRLRCRKVLSPQFIGGMKARRIKYAPGFDRSLRKLSQENRERTIEAIRHFIDRTAENSLRPEKKSGLKGIWAFRVTDGVRVFYVQNRDGEGASASCFS